VLSKYFINMQSNSIPGYIHINNMDIITVMTHLGRVDSFLIRNAQPNGPTAQQIRNELILRFNQLTGLNVNLVATPGQYGNYDTIDKNLVAQALTKSIEVNAAITTIDTFLQNPIRSVLPNANSINYISIELIQVSPIVQDEAIRIKINEESLSQEIENLQSQLQLRLNLNSDDDQ
jgi:hypothetical protein